jgi:hypothetical protein
MLDCPYHRNLLIPFYPWDLLLVKDFASIELNSISRNIEKEQSKSHIAYQL